MVSTSRRAAYLVSALFAAAVVLGLGAGVLVGFLGSDGPTDAAEGPTDSAGGPPPRSPQSPTTSATPSLRPPTTRADTDLERGRRADVGYLVASRARPDGTHVSFDRVQLLTGSAARDSATKSKRRLPLSGVLIVNENRRIRDLVLSPEVKVYGLLALAGSTEVERIPVQALLAALPTKGSAVPLALRYDALGYVVEVRERSRS